MGSRTTNPTPGEVLEELKVRPVAERARIVGRVGEILDAKREDRDDGGVDFGRYRIFPRLRLLLREGVKVDIGTRAFDVLWVLVQADGELVSKDQLIDIVWSRVVVEENNLQAQMSAIRRALGADRGMIRTEFGLGYRLVAEKPKTPRSAAFRSCKAPADRDGRLGDNGREGDPRCPDLKVQPLFLYLAADIADHSG